MKITGNLVIYDPTVHRGQASQRPPQFREHIAPCSSVIYESARKTIVHDTADDRFTKSVENHFALGWMKIDAISTSVVNGFYSFIKNFQILN